MKGDQEPRLPNHLELAERPEELLYMERIQQETLMGWKIVSGNFSEEDLSDMNIQGCVFQGCRFSGCNLKGTSFTDVVFRNCDFSGSQAKNLFAKRCEFVNVKALGAQWLSGHLECVTIRQSNFSQANLSDSSMQQVRMEEVEFVESWLNECKWKQLELKGCNFTRTSFFKTTLKGLDFTSGDLHGIVVSDDGRELKGAVVNSRQAVSLASILGVIVRE